MTFREVKAHAIYFLLELEKQGKISRMDGYQGILNAIAGDVRSKNRRRVQRQHEKESMEEALKYLDERKRYFEEQINSYNNYVETSMHTMQRGKGYDMQTSSTLMTYKFHIQEKTLCPTLHETILPHARVAKVREDPSVWFVQV